MAEWSYYMKNKKERPATAPIKYGSLIEIDKKHSKSTFSWWQAPWFIIFMTITFSALDGLVMYSVFDTVMLQSEIMGYVMSVGMALTINLIPVFMANAAHDIRLGKRYSKSIFLTLLISFLVLAIAITCLRFSVLEIYDTSFNQASIQNQIYSGSSTLESAVEYTPSIQSIATATLLSISPLVTSVINFYISYIAGNPIEKALRSARQNRYRLEENRSDLLGAKISVEQKIEQYINGELSENEKLRYQAFCECINMQYGKHKSTARLLLAEHLQDADKVAQVTESSSSATENTNTLQEEVA